MLTNILQYLEASAARVPDKLAFSDGEEGLCFAELLRISRAIGSGLLEKGLQHEAVAVLMDKSPMTLAAFFGVVYAGCFYVPLDTEMPVGRMQKILENVTPRVLICAQKSAKTAESLAFDGEIVSVETLAAVSACVARLSAVRDGQIDTDPIYIVFTSGSTGLPKGVVACHRSVIDYTESLCEALPFDEETVFGNQTPLFFDAPLKEIMPTLKYGATTYLIPKKLFMVPIRLAEYLNAHKINTICWVVSALTMLSSLGALEKCPPEYLHTVAFGSEVFPTRQFNLWRQALPQARFFNLYGPTEATGMSCYYEAKRTFSEGEAIPVGRPFRNTDILLLDEAGQRVPLGQTGEICMRGTCVTLGYYRNAEKTSAAFVQNPLNTAYPELIYKTGDLGYFDADGNLIFVGRRDFQIKHMGHRVELGEIEAAAASFDCVARAACIYDAEQKKIVLYYTSCEGSDEEKTLTAGLRSLLPRYMLPAVVRRLENMPLTPNGKLDRGKLASFWREEQM